MSKHLLSPVLITRLLRPSSVKVAPFLLPFLQTPHRSASILANLSDIPAAYNRKIKRGRGPSSGRGKTSGRGHKGQKQHGKVPRGFNGGQTPDIVVSGTRGFKNVFSIDLTPLNLDKLQSWISQGRLDPNRPITLKDLSDSRIVSGITDGVKLLARGSETLTTPINIIVSRASAAAIATIEAAGGSVTTRYYTPFSIQRILRGRTDPINSLNSRPKLALAEGETKITPDSDTSLASPGFMNRLPDPTSRKDIEYYRDPAHRGYLSYQLEEGQGPSLYFKTPGTGKKKVAKERKPDDAPRKVAAGDNRIF